MNKDDIKFIREKDFTFLKEIGQGALGKTVLLKDEDLNTILTKFWDCKLNCVNHL